MPTTDPGMDPELLACVDVTRRLGADPSLVLHGGGNSSVKTTTLDITGRSIETLWIKGSGADMASIDVGGFTPLRLERLRELLSLDRLDDETMMRELAAARLDPGAPAASVETLLHAVLPARQILHSHADAIVTLTNLAEPGRLVDELYGDEVLAIPYVMPGFQLGRLVADRWRALDPGHAARLTALVLLNHGLVTFGETADQAYERHLALVERATRWLDEHAPRPDGAAPDELPGVGPVVLADLRRRLSSVAGRPLIVRRHTDPATRRFVARPDLATITAHGPLTPDHVIRTKRRPLVGTDVEAFAAAYTAEFEAQRARVDRDVTMLDPAPRVILDPRLGALCAGATARDADIAEDIWQHTMPVIERAEDHLGGYRSLPADDLFDVEYWTLEQAKLRSDRPAPPLRGLVALVTGAASGIGRATAAALLDQGAAVIGVDLADGVVDAFAGPAWVGCVVDVRDPAAQRAALARGVEAFGGVDIVVVAAGVFGATRPIADLAAEDWRAMFAVNVDAVADLFGIVHPILAVSPVGGRVVVVASKNVHAPGPGAAAYSASKAALTQLARVAALEWAADGIRVNQVHPDAVFDTGLWSDELIRERAGRYGLSVEAYKRRNLLGREITAAAVARGIVALCGDDFAMTTGAQVSIDGGNERTL